MLPLSRSKKADMLLKNIPSLDIDGENVCVQTPPFFNIVDSPSYLVLN